MSDDSIHSANYEMARTLTRDWSVVERTVMFVLFFANGLILWHLPGVWGLATGGVVFLFVGVGVVGELWRQFEIRVLGKSDGRGQAPEGEP